MHIVICTYNIYVYKANKDDRVTQDIDYTADTLKQIYVYIYTYCYMLESCDEFNEFLKIFSL